MLNEIVRWMSDRKTDRRTADRKKVQFALGWMRGEETVSGVGTEISLNGLLFATKSAPKTPSFNIVMTVAGRRMKARLSTVRTETATREGTVWTMLACTFEGIAADDYDAIVRFIRDEPDPDAGQKDTHPTYGADDAYRMLPMPVQEQIVRVLIDVKRLAPNTDPRNPLLRMKYQNSKNGKHRFAVHSRISVSDEIYSYDSIFVVDDHGIVVLER